MNSSQDEMLHRDTRTPRGFTLVELMVVVAIASVLLTMAAPSFTEFALNSRITAVANDFLGAIQVARTEAIKRQAPVAVCPSDNPEETGATCTTGPFRGWIAFVDADNNCLRDAGSETVLRVGPRFDTESHRTLTPISNGTCISFAATGFRQTISGRPPASHTLLCDERGSKKLGTDLVGVRGINVDRTGRAYITRNESDIKDWATEAIVVACP